MGKKRTIEESQCIRDIAEIMSKGGGPFTRKQLATALAEIYPELSYQEIMLKVSAAIQDDKFANNRFKSAGQGYWDLAEK
jgi:hypothetical protein